MLEIENITNEERNKIEELKNKIGHELTPTLQKDKSLYYRFLKARDFNIRDAETLIRKSIADRKFYKTDEILKTFDPPEHIYEYIPFSFIGFDKNGSTVRYIDFGRADHKGILSLFTFPQIVSYVAFNLEEDVQRLTKQSMKTGKSITKFVLVLDMEKMSLFQSTFKKGMEALMKGFELYQDNYPERIKAVYVINASFYFNIGYTIVKPVLSSVLQQKIQIFGKDGWKEALRENISLDVLPAFLGGDRTDSDGNPLCYSLVAFGKKVPENLYAKKKKSIINENGVKKLTITRFSTKEIMLYVYEENTRIEWEFETKSKDIGFGLLYKDSSKINPEIVELIPKQRIDTMLSSEAGIYTCEKIGTYIIVFDNSYSWIYSKELYYRIQLIKPDKSKSSTNLN